MVSEPHHTRKMLDSYTKDHNSLKVVIYEIMLGSIHCSIHLNISEMSLSGNLLIITTVCVSKLLKGPTNLFLASLAVADLLIVALCIPIRVCIKLCNFTNILAIFNYDLIKCLVKKER